MRRNKKKNKPSYYRYIYIYGNREKINFQINHDNVFFYFFLILEKKKN